MKNLTAAKLFLCIMGVLMFLMGLVTLFMPMATLATLAILLGVGFLIAGIFCIISYFSEKEILLSPGWVLIQGILDIIVGVILLWNIGATIIALPFILAFWMMFGGISRIAAAFTAKRYGIDKWWLVLINGILGILVAFILFIPGVGQAAVVALIGAYLLVYGFLIFIEALTTKIPELPDFFKK